MSKSIFVSKTFYANVIALGVAVAQHYGISVPGSPDPVTFTMILAGANLVLRLLTKQPVALPTT